MHILTQSHHKLSQTTNTQRTLQEDLKRHGNALLPPSGNSLSKSTLCDPRDGSPPGAPPSLGFSRQEHWSGLPFPSPMHESEK